MPKRKASKTQLAINNINSYIKNVAKTFGVNSKEYESITQQLHGHGFTFKDSTILQLRNTKQNRAKHQTIRAINKRKKSITILKRPYERRRKEFMKNIPESIKRGEEIKSFYRWYAENVATINDLVEEVYTLLEVAQFYGLEYEAKTLFKNETFRREAWQEVFDAGAKDFATLDELLQHIADSMEDMFTDTQTGENMTYTNDDYEGMESGVEYD